ncbi:MAG: cbb3-type cytochrome c oxidase subunit I, partial [Ferruginibacter sp.]
MTSITRKILSFFTLILIATALPAQPPSNYISTKDGTWGMMLILVVIIVFLLIITGYSYLKFKRAMKDKKLIKTEGTEGFFKNLTSQQIDSFLKQQNATADKKSTTIKNSGIMILLLFISSVANGQDTATNTKSLITQPGIIITIVLLVLPLLFAALLMINKARNAVKRISNEEKIRQATVLMQQLKKISSPELQEELLHRREALNFALTNQELSGSEKVFDERGIITHVNDKHQVHFTAVKKRASQRPVLDPGISKLIIWYLGCAAFWLVVGTGIGEYVGIKFIVPDADHISWLSFGRLRPVHTNIVFWGWASLGILGLGHYVVPTVSNTKLYSVKWGWIALWLTNLMVILGTISLMSGINN